MARKQRLTREQAAKKYPDERVVLGEPELEPGPGGVSTAIGREDGYRIRVRCFESLGYSSEDFSMNFLRRFDVDVLFPRGERRVRRAREVAR